MKLFTLNQIRNILKKYREQYCSILGSPANELKDVEEFIYHQILVYASKYSEVLPSTNHSVGVLVSKESRTPFYVLAALMQTMYRLTILFHSLMSAVKDIQHETAVAVTRSTIENYSRLAFIYYKLLEIKRNPNTQEDVMNVIHDMWFLTRKEFEQSEVYKKNPESFSRLVSEYGEKYEKEIHQRFIAVAPKELHHRHHSVSHPFISYLSNKQHANHDATKGFMNLFHKRIILYQYDEQVVMMEIYECLAQWTKINEYVWECYQDIQKLYNEVFDDEYRIFTMNGGMNAVSALKLNTSKDYKDNNLDAVIQYIKQRYEYVGD